MLEILNDKYFIFHTWIWHPWAFKSLCSIDKFLTESKYNGVLFWSMSYDIDTYSCLANDLYSIPNDTTMTEQEYKGRNNISIKSKNLIIGNIDKQNLFKLKLLITYDIIKQR